MCYVGWLYAASKVAIRVQAFREYACTQDDSSSQLLAIQSVTTNNLIAGCAQSLKKAWSLVLKGVVWAEFK